MSNKKNIASILMLGATTIGLTGSMSTSAGLLDFLNWKEAKARDDAKEAQGYQTAEKVAKIFLEEFDKGKEGEDKDKDNNKKTNKAIKVLEDLVLEKFNEDEVEIYYKEKFKNMTQKLTLGERNIFKVLDSFGNYTTVKFVYKNTNYNKI